MVFGPQNQYIGRNSPFFKQYSGEYGTSSDIPGDWVHGDGFSFRLNDVHIVIYIVRRWRRNLFGFLSEALEIGGFTTVASSLPSAINLSVGDQLGTTHPKWFLALYEQ